jgi:hypothetical protein
VLELAKEVVEAEREVDPAEERDRAKEALTELFEEAKGTNTHIIVERIVTDIDDIVKKVRFPEWQKTTQGERLVQKELRRTRYNGSPRRNGSPNSKLLAVHVLPGERIEDELASVHQCIINRFVSVFVQEEACASV